MRRIPRTQTLALLCCSLLAGLAIASEPAFLDWTHIQVDAGRLSLDAKKESRYFTHFRISTEWGEFSLSQEQIEMLRDPVLKSLNAVVFPLTVDGLDHEYHIQLRYRDKDFDDREDDCWDSDMYLPYDFARILIDDSGIHKIELRRSKCEKSD